MVNKDTKKSKFSDTLHRFCKKARAQQPCSDRQPCRGAAGRPAACLRGARCQRSLPRATSTAPSTRLPCLPQEHDWGWKKFMELGKVGEGFTAGDTLTVKAQVQVVRDRPARPFPCLDAGYRRELLRVYLSNVEGLARRFVDEKREYLQVRAGEDGGGQEGAGGGRKGGACRGQRGQQVGL